MADTRTPMRLLVVEDAADLALALTEGLERHGFVVDVCDDVEAAIVMAISQNYAGLILDRRLPRGDGIEVCRALRSRGSAVPILMLTARDALADRVEGLDAGADDYLVKPFAFTELVARARALTRRHGAARSNILQAGDVSVDVSTGRVMRGDSEVAVSAKERLLLIALMRNPGRLLTHAQLVDQAWNMDAEPSPDVIRAHIKNVRRKLQPPGAKPLIETVHGLGYRIVT